VVGRILLILLLSSIALAQTRPTSTFSAITITGVEGLVQYRASEQDKWQPARPGMEIAEGGEFRTGPRSAVRIAIPPDQTLTLDRLGTIKLLEVLRGATIKTDVGMKYGRVRYDIEAAGEKHDSTIYAPSSTLAVRGTVVSLYDQPPFRAQAISLTGQAYFRDERRRMSAFGGKAKAKVTNDHPDAAAGALAESNVDPATDLARTPAENRLLNALVAKGAVLGFDPVNQIPTVSGGPGPLSGRELIAALPGSFNIVLGWTANANLDLAVANIEGQRSEVIRPVFPLNRAASGGRTDFDHRGGPRGGQEVVYYPTGPSGTYAIAGIKATGPATPFRIDVFLDGKQICSTGTTLSKGADFNSIFVNITPKGCGPPVLQPKRR
jgi:hypothetical protein